MNGGSDLPMVETEGSRESHAKRGDQEAESRMKGNVDEEWRSWNAI
jgi:hypothetical protein